MAKSNANKAGHGNNSSRGANKRPSPNKSGQTSRRGTLIIGVVAIVLLLTGGLIAALQGDRTASQGAQTAVAQAAQVAEHAQSFYQEVSIQRIAEVIENEEHSLVYFRSPT